MKLGVIIILYNPEHKHLERLIKSLKGDIHIFLVDNSPESKCNRLLFLDQFIGVNLSYKHLNQNKGIAEAQNIALSEALQMNEISHILFLDQDSTITDDFANKMLAEYKRIEKTGIKLAAIGPTLINSKTMEMYKIKNSWESEAGSDFVVTDKLISSGMVVKKHIFRLTGLMDKSLFIDAVDFEWCWRANSKGYTCCITKNVKMEHQVGIKTISVLGYPVIISKPSRYYYQYRNLFFLIRRSYVPRSWKTRSLLKRMILLFYLPIIAPEGRIMFKNMFIGMLDGISNRVRTNVKNNL